MNNKIKKIKSCLLIILMLTIFLIPSIIFAGGGNMEVDLKTFNPIKAEDIMGLIRAIVDFILKIGAAVVIIFVIYAGFQFVTAQGNEDKISKAKTAFFWTIVGALIILGAYTLSGIICQTAKQLGATTISC
jgi:hypothetical protein